MGLLRLWGLGALFSVWGLAASGVTLTKVSEDKPWAGVVVRKYRTSSPAADLWVARVDLCQSSIHVDATQSPSGVRATGSWAQSVGAQLATNGDFYKTSPNHVYGPAVGDGIPWPSVQTGFDPRYSSEWYYQRGGWIAFLFDRVEWSHTRWVKRNPPAGQTLGGFSPTRVTADIPPGTLALVSGYSELVIEGTRVTCSSPTASTCFPDRPDMRARHPRTAMGLTQDLKTFLLVVVDGRTTRSSGMYGAELAETMSKLGAWQAFNLDGGGSSQFWQKGAGYRNNYDGNNHGSGLRAVMNHWGVFAGSGNGKPTRPGHCVASPPCKTIPASGGTIDNGSSCFRTFGPSAGWRKVSAGSGGSLYWTNAISGSLSENWAWWQLHLAAAGTYRVEYFADPAYARFSRTRYEVMAGGRSTTLTVNQSRGTGWTSLGTFDFAEGGGQFVRLYDNPVSGSVSSGQKIAADAIRLVPAAPACGDGTCGSSETCTSCASDCGACTTCGDGACAAGESCSTCAADCGDCCGNGQCVSGESCSTCAADCGTCPRCGDGACNGAESCSTCAGDCGACCGDEVCDGSESCEGCPVDCGACVRCGDGICNGDEMCSSCAADCGACVRCGDGVCGSGETCSSCVSDCGACSSCGNDTCDPGETCSSCEADCGACRSCGDGSCDPGESCSSCEADCGSCCGDGDCDTGETCSNCARDCGPCAGCGDGRCGSGETCDTCSTDCGACVRCGDGRCLADEACDNCETDCGPCDRCGDGACGEAESCGGCPADCGICTGTSTGSSGGTDTPAVSTSVPPEAGCQGCQSTGWTSALGVAGIFLARRRRRRPE